jgi:hypothetical protein
MLVRRIIEVLLDVSRLTRRLQSRIADVISGLLFSLAAAIQRTACDVVVSQIHYRRSTLLTSCPGQMSFTGSRVASTMFQGASGLELEYYSR